MITKFPILVFRSSFTSFTPYLLNWSWGWKFAALLQSSNLNIKWLAFSSKVSALKIAYVSTLSRKIFVVFIFIYICYIYIYIYYIYSSCFKLAHLGMLTRKLALYLFGGSNKPINKLCVHFNQWRFLKIFSFIRKEKSMVLHSELPFQIVRSSGRRTLAATV